MQNKNPNQIIRLDGRNVFLEVMNNAFPIGKVQINFVEYDVSAVKGNRQKHNIPIYIDIERFIALAYDIQFGRMEALAKKAREEQGKSGFRFCKEAWLYQGGVSTRKLGERSKARKDGKSLSRQFRIIPGDKLPWVLTAEVGPGEERENGLIVPAYNKPDEIVRVGLSEESFKMFATVSIMHIQAFINSQYEGVFQSRREAL